MGHLKDPIIRAVEEAIRIDRNPLPTPTRVTIGLALIRFGIRLFKKII